MGRWENIKKDGNSLKADAIIDVGDPKGAIINNKVENDFIRAASIGFRIIETSDDPKQLLPGQKYPTITKCELVEISIVDIPANKNALALYDTDGNRIELKEDCISATLSMHLKREPINPTKILNNMKIKILAAWTYLSAFFATENGKDAEIDISPEKLSELNDKLSQLSVLKTENEKLTSDHVKLKTDFDALKTEKEKLSNDFEAFKKTVPAVADPAQLGDDPGGKKTAPEESEADAELTRLRAATNTNPVVKK
jgi:hypothetical protein